jgi:uncharacterized protein (TIGR02217 family)
MPQPFLDIAFPGSVGRGATGGPGFSTQIVTLASGAEQRNVNWSQARGRWNISTGIRSRVDMAAVIAHFHVVKGRAYGLLFKDLPLQGLERFRRRRSGDGADHDDRLADRQTLQPLWL